MHHLLIQQAIIDEIVRQTYSQGKKALSETTFEGLLINAELKKQEITDEEIDKWLAHLSVDEYVELTAKDHHRDPFYITITKKGVMASNSQYFKEQYNDKNRENVKAYVQIASQIILGTAALFAFIATAGKSCTKPPNTLPQEQTTTTTNTTAETKADSNHPYSSPILKKDSTPNPLHNNGK